MRRSAIVISALMLVALQGGARSQRPKDFYERALAAISTPMLYGPEDPRPTDTPVLPRVNLRDPGPSYRGSDGAGQAANRQKSDLGLTIAGTAVTGLGAAIIIADKNQSAPEGKGGVIKGDRPELDIIGKLLILLGTALIVPGMIMLLRR